MSEQTIPGPKIDMQDFSRRTSYDSSGTAYFESLMAQAEEDAKRRQAYMTGEHEALRDEIASSAKPVFDKAEALSRSGAIKEFVDKKMHDDSEFKIVVISNEELRKRGGSGPDAVWFTRTVGKVTPEERPSLTGEMPVTENIGFDLTNRRLWRSVGIMQGPPRIYLSEGEVDLYPEGAEGKIEGQVVELEQTRQFADGVITSVADMLAQVEQSQVA